MTSARSPQVLRRMNADALLRFALRGSAFDAGEAMAATGLTRATVLGVCRDLVAEGWLDELPAAEPGRAGRPALRYRLRASAGFALGVAVAESGVTATVADLAGLARGSAEAALEPADLDPATRRATVVAVASRACETAGVSVDDILVTVAGVPAPVTADGRSPSDATGYWAGMNPGLVDALPGRTVVIENDANLAALAERSVLPDGERDDFAALLSGDRLGTGLVVDGRLLRGRRGGVGELRALGVVADVGTADGMERLALSWAREAVAAGRATVLRDEGEGLAVADILRAWTRGDAVAAEVAERLAIRLARIAAVLGSLFDVESVVVTGSLASDIEPLLARARQILAEESPPPVPALRAGEFGAEAVLRGAMCEARDRILGDPLAHEPRGRH